MNIILVPGNLSKSRTLHFGQRQLLLLGLAFLVLPFLLVVPLYYMALPHAAQLDTPFSVLSPETRQAEAPGGRAYVQQNLNTMSARLGQLQSQLLRLDALGERLAKSAGIKPQDFRLGQLPARGGATSSLPQRELSLTEFSAQLGALAEQLDDRGDQLAILESLLLQDNVKKRVLPSLSPVSVGWYSSNYGWRIDPFNGKEAFHEGVDFMADPGTAIVAAAGGVVAYSDYHSEYGNMIAINHGNGLVSRYAHASKRLVGVGDVVLKGEKIAEVGTTGRSTGPHLHFEVRLNGAPQNPARFLRQPG